MTTTIDHIYKELREKLSDIEARIILKERAGIDWSDIIANPSREIETTAVMKDMAERVEGKPLSKIYGKKEFWGMEFATSENTLDPRPDSETLIEVALKHYKDKEPPKTILDLGTGTGCLLISLLCEFPNAQGIGIDLSDHALEIAQKNAESHGLATRCELIKGEWTANLDGKFDLIVSNPPYIASNIIPNLEKEVKNYDPILALDGGSDGLQAYKDIFSDLNRVLNDDGIALFEIGFDQADDMRRLSEEYKIRLGDIYPDLAGNPRVVDMFKN